MSKAPRPGLLAADKELGNGPETSALIRHGLKERVR